MNSDIEAIVRKLALASHDNDVKGIALIFINSENQPEIEMSFGAGYAFAMNTGVDLLKDAILEKIKAVGTIEPKDRE